jgi:hypothetical protein
VIQDIYAMKLEIHQLKGPYLKEINLLKKDFNAIIKEIQRLNMHREVTE